MVRGWEGARGKWAAALSRSVQALLRGALHQPVHRHDHHQEIDQRGQEVRKKRLNLTRERLAARLAEAGVPAYRAGQLFSWVYRRHQGDPAAMSSLPLALRLALAVGLTVVFCTPPGNALGRAPWPFTALSLLCAGLCILGVAARAAAMLLSAWCALWLVPSLPGSSAPVVLAAALALMLTGAGRPRLWVHAVSVGEVFVAARFMEEIRAARPGWQKKAMALRRYIPKASTASFAACRQRAMSWV